MQTRKYYPEVNVARGIALMCVMLGHSFPDVSNGFGSRIAEIIYLMMYSFHMGCFFMLSGFVSGNSLCNRKCDIKTKTLSKIKRLIVPYLFYSVLVFLLKLVLVIYVNNSFQIKDLWKIAIGKSPHGGMWYLWTLFIVSFLFLILNQFSTNKFIYGFVGATTCILYYLIPETWASNILKYTVFYVVGILLQQYYANFIVFLSKCKIQILVAVSILFAVSFFEGLPYHFTGLLGSVIVLVVSKTISDRRSIVNGCFSELGNYSYDIYLLSYFSQVGVQIVFYKILHLPYFIVVISMLVLGTIIPYYASKLICRRLKWVKRIALGNWE